ncbi:n-acetylneuraminate 9-O-acetyltransferase [Trichonephila clavipes]|nr:n-acetylneuraminate 9-O-acetyltransferase [Trichonephila clavipes]
MTFGSTAGSHFSQPPVLPPAMMLSPHLMPQNGVPVNVFSLKKQSYAIFAFLCRNKLECNEVHPYISFVPILSYIILRNISSYLRTKYSMFFAWFGNISLEI